MKVLIKTGLLQCLVLFTLPVFADNFFDVIPTYQQEHSHSATYTSVSVYSESNPILARNESAAFGNQSSMPKMKADSPKEVALLFNELFWNFKDVQAGAQLLSADFVAEEPSNNFNATPLPRDEAVTKRRFLANTMPGLNYKVEKVVVEGATVVVFTNAAFTHTKVVKTKVGIAAPTGGRIEYKTIMKYTIKDKKITKMWLLYDMYSRDKQLGLYRSE